MGAILKSVGCFMGIGRPAPAKCSRTLTCPEAADDYEGLEGAEIAPGFDNIDSGLGA